MKRRDIALAIILSFITCGIYQIYWFVTLTEDINDLSGDHSTSGAVSFLLTVITCGIYGIYWAYKMGQNMNVAKSNRGIMSTGTDMPIVYLLLQIFGLNIINLSLMQNEVNNMSL